MVDMLYSENSRMILNEPGERAFAENIWQMVENCRDARAHLAAEAVACHREALSLTPNADSENIVFSILEREPARCNIHLARLAVLKLVQAKEFFVNARIISDHELKLYSQLRRCVEQENVDRFEKSVRSVEDDRQGYIHAIVEINDTGKKLPISKLGLNSVWRE